MLRVGFSSCRSAEIGCCRARRGKGRGRETEEDREWALRRKKKKSGESLARVQMPSVQRGSQQILSYSIGLLDSPVDSQVNRTMNCLYSQFVQDFSTWFPTGVLQSVIPPDTVAFAPIDPAQRAREVGGWYCQYHAIPVISGSPRWQTPHTRTHSHARLSIRMYLTISTCISRRPPSRSDLSVSI